MTDQNTKEAPQIDQHDEDYINYIITVHGIGDQIYNETVLPIINGFGNVLHNSPSGKDLVTLGMVNSQTGTISGSGNTLTFNRLSDQQVWAEFEGIPNSLDTKNGPDFDGSTPEDPDGKNMRFVDMYWADILEADAKVSVQPINKWTESIIGRIKLLKGNDDESKARDWLEKLLEVLNEIILFLNSFLAFQFKDQHKVIFNKYLSDVQVYAEHLNIRGRAVLRFHRMMEKIHKTHWAKEKEKEHDYQRKKPRYIIISHSLGSVLAADALCLAGFIKKYGTEDKAIFASYKEGEDQKPVPALDWLYDVQTLVTLGSPVDKYISLWPNNYQYLNQDIDERITKKIRHLNYCDEQDPVGHKLNLFRAKNIYKKLFQSYNVVKEGDKTTYYNTEVYNRSGVPGKAHTDYWSDYKLLEHIIKTGINQNDKDEPLVDVLPDRKWAFAGGLTIAYFAVPFIAMIVLNYLFLESFELLEDYKEEWLTISSISVGFVASAYFFNKLIKLFAYWRQILIAKGQDVNEKEKGKISHVYQKWRSKKVRTLRYGVLLALLVIFHRVSAPKLATWQPCQWYSLSIYLAALLAAYFLFLLAKKLFIPSTVIFKIKNILGWLIPLAVSILIMAISFFIVDLSGQPKPLSFVNDSVAIGFAISVSIWTLLCLQVERSRKEMKQLLRNHSNKIPKAKKMEQASPS